MSTDDSFADLDAAFELPAEITDLKLRGLYEVLVARLRDEAKHLPMGTINQLLIERIAYNYIVMRSKERGELGGFAHSNVQKDFNSFWLSMTSEFNRLLGRSDGGLGVTDRKALLKEIQQIVVSTVAAIADPRVRADLLEQFAVKFDAAGI